MKDIPGNYSCCVRASTAVFLQAWPSLLVFMEVCFWNVKCLLARTARTSKSLCARSSVLGTVFLCYRGQALVFLVDSMWQQAVSSCDRPDGLWAHAAACSVRAVPRSSALCKNHLHCPWVHSWRLQGHLTFAENLRWSPDADVWTVHWPVIARAPCGVLYCDSCVCAEVFRSVHGPLPGAGLLHPRILSIPSNFDFGDFELS